MNLPLIGCNIENLLKISVKSGYRLKAAPLRHQFHTVRVLLHIFTCHLHPHQIQVIGRRHVHNFLEHPAEMRFRHMALLREIPDRQLLRVMRANVMQRKGNLRNAPALFPDLDLLSLIHAGNIYKERQL